jgi:hypothetical protein
MDPGPIEGERLAGTDGWSHLVAFDHQGEWHVLSYNGESGHFRAGPANPDAGADDIAVGTWEHPWTELVPLPFAPGSEHVGSFLKYDEASGNAELARLNEQETEIETLALGNLGAGWSRLASFQTGSETRLVAYSAGDGLVAIFRLELAETITFVAHDQDLWRERVSDILPVQISGTPFAVTHSAETGVVDVLRLDPLEDARLPTVR